MADKKLWMHTSGAACTAILTISSGFPGFHSSLWQKGGTTTANLLLWSRSCPSTITDCCDVLRSFATEKIPNLLVSHAAPHHDYIALLCTCWKGQAASEPRHKPGMLQRPGGWGRLANIGSVWQLLTSRMHIGCNLKAVAIKVWDVSTWIIEDHQSPSPSHLLNHSPQTSGFPWSRRNGCCITMKGSWPRTWHERSTVLPNQKEKAYRYLLCRQPFLKKLRKDIEKYMLQANKKESIQIIQNTCYNI